MKSFFLHYQHEFVFYGFSVVTILLMWPNLYHKTHFGHEDHAGHSSLESAILSEKFKFMVYASFAIAFPLSVDVFIDLLTKRRLVKQIFARAYICFILIFSATLYTHFSLIKQLDYPTIIIRDMTSVMSAALTCHQIQIRSPGNIATKYYYGMFLGFAIGNIFYSYSHVPSSYLVGYVMRLIAVFCLIFINCKHISLVVRGGNIDQNFYDRWHQAALEVVILGSLIVATLATVYLSMTDKSTDNVALSGKYEIVVSFCHVVSMVLMSTVITNEYRHAYTQLEQKLGIKRRFVRYVSHEVRTPLSSCMLGIAYMRKAIQQPTQACIEEISTILEEVSEGCNTAIDFINNLLLYEKIDTLEMPLYQKREDLREVCNEVLKTFYMSARQLELNLSLVVHESLQGSSFPPCANIDGPKIVIVLRNLMSNALKFTPKDGSVSLTIIPVNISTTTASTFSSGGGGDVISSNMIAVTDIVNLPPSSPTDTTHFRVILSDTGRGMSKDEQQQLFTKIVQFNPNENQKGGGSGIGLFLSHQIMEGHGLNIQVYSKGVAGKGTQFYIDFPVMSSEEGVENDDVGGRELERGGLVAQSPVSSVVCSPCCAFSCCSAAAVHDIEAGKSSLTKEDEKRDALTSANTNVLAKNEVESSQSNGSYPPHLMNQSTYATDIGSPNVSVPPPLLLEKKLNELSILIVDDSALNRKMLLRTLKQNHVGATYKDVGDGLELLAQLGVPVMAGGSEAGSRRRAGSGSGAGVESDLQLQDLENNDTATCPNKYDVIILDDNMTYMNGSVAVSRLREWGYGGLVIGVTGSVQTEDMEAFCAAGVNFVLPKPFVVQDFIALVQSQM